MTVMSKKMHKLSEKCCERHLHQPGKQPPALKSAAPRVSTGHRDQNLTTPYVSQPVLTSTPWKNWAGKAHYLFKKGKK